MALQKSQFSLNLIKGVDTKTDQKLTDGLLTLENGVFEKTGTIRKRHGFTSLGTTDGGGTTITGTTKLFSHQKALGLLTETSYYTYDNNSSRFIEPYAHSSTYISSVLNATYTGDIIRETNDYVLNIDQCDAGDYIFYLWVNSAASTRLYYALQDKTTKEFVKYKQDLGDPTSTYRIRCVSTTNNVITAHTNSSSGTATIYLNAAAKSGIYNEGTFPSGITITTDASGTGSEDYTFDMVWYNDKLWVMYKNASRHVRLAIFDEDLNSIDNIAIDSTSDDYTAFAMSGGGVDEDQMFVSYYDPTNQLISYAMVDDNTTTISIANSGTLVSGFTYDVKNAIAYTDQTSTELITVIYENQQSATASNIKPEARRYNSGLNSVSSSNVPFWTTPDLKIQSRAVFDAAGSPYAMFRHVNSGVSRLYRLGYQGTTVQSGDVLPIGTFGVGQVADSPEGWLPSALNLGSDEINFATLETSTVATGALGVGRRAKRLSVDVTPNNLAGEVEVGGGTLFPGTYPKYFDGTLLKELGYYARPTIISASDTTGGSLSAGDYLVYAVYEWIDAQGRIHRSTPSDPESVTVTNNAISVSYDEQNAPEGAYTRFFLTEAGGSIAYFSAAQRLIPRTALNSITLTSVSSSSEVLYTESGELAAVACPPCGHLSVWNGRVWASGLEDDNEIWYSKLLNSTYAPEFNEAFSVELLEGSGGVTATYGLDSNLIIFKENDLFFLAGEGPNDLGEGVFSDIERISSDVGCPQPRSIVGYPDGLLFMSNKGIYSLSRGLAVSYIGAPVEDFNGEEIVSAELVEDVNEVRFATRSGSMLVYNYYFGQWSVFTGKDSKDAAMWNGTYVYLDNSDDTVKKEDTTLYNDDGTFYSMKLKTGWIKLAGVQGFQRVNRIQFLGEYFTPHNFELKVRHNFDSTVNDTKTFDAATNASDVYQHEYHVKLQKCNSIQLEIRDDDTDQTPGTGQSYSLTNVTFMIGVKGGINKLNSDRTY